MRLHPIFTHNNVRTGGKLHPYTSTVRTYQHISFQPHLRPTHHYRQRGGFFLRHPQNAVNRLGFEPRTLKLRVSCSNRLELAVHLINANFPLYLLCAFCGSWHKPHRTSLFHPSQFPKKILHAKEEGHFYACRIVASGQIQEPLNLIHHNQHTDSRTNNPQALCDLLLPCGLSPHEFVFVVTHHFRCSIFCALVYQIHGNKFVTHPFWLHFY